MSQAAPAISGGSDGIWLLRISHSQRLAPIWRHVQNVLLDARAVRRIFVLDFSAERALIAPFTVNASGAQMRWVPRSFPVEIRRKLNVADLADVSEQQLEQADEEGALAGNRYYFDMRGFSWQDVRAALEAEIAIIDRLKSAEDLEAELANFEELQATSFDDEPALWGLDVGVVAATIALSAYGAIPRLKLQCWRVRRSTPVTISLCRVFPTKGPGSGNFALRRREQCWSPM